MPCNWWSQLVDACQNLLYPSETDAPVRPVELAPPFPWNAPGLDVREQPVHEFFDALDAAPHAAGFHALYLLLAARLEDLRVHRIGRIRVDVYVTGRPRDAACGQTRIGVHTVSVET